MALKGLIEALVMYGLSLTVIHADAIQNPTSPSSRSHFEVRGMPVHRVPLRQSSSSSPYCLAVSTTSNLPLGCNFLATQVWPSARVAARALQQYSTLTTSGAIAKTSMTICELGCGPGLPSLTAAAECHNVVATDVDELALELVQAAADEQGLGHRITTRKVDLVNCASTGWEDDWMKSVDLFVMSDVFESKAVAIGAAKFTKKVLSTSTTSRVWVFAQTDRAQREVYRNELRRMYLRERYIGWSTYDEYNPEDRLWLCDLDETRVNYG
jgi:hypothetical protein